MHLRPRRARGYQEHDRRPAGGRRAPSATQLLRQLVDIQYERNDVDFARGTFRVRGDVVEIHPAYEEHGVRIEFFGDEIERITEIDPLTGEVLARERARDLSRRPTT